jgi:hypothetical protein
MDPPIPRWVRVTTPRLDSEPGDLAVTVRYVEALRPSMGKATLAYVLRSGALWEGRIGRAVVTVQTAAPEVSLLDPVPPAQSAAADRVRWDFADLEPDRDLSVTVRVPLTAREEELLRQMEETIRKDRELDGRMEEIREKEKDLEKTYEEYLKALEEHQKNGEGR